MDYLTIGILIVFHVALFGGCGWVIWRHIVKKRWLNEGALFVGRNVYSQFQNADNQERIEHIIYMEEDEREEDPSGEPDKKDGGKDTGTARVEEQ